VAKSTDFLSLAIIADIANMRRIKARQVMRQTTFLLEYAVERFEAHFAPAIMAEKRHIIRQTTF
jgi:hypothetical protein